jgi:nucleotide-binding universal stress UspA family protein
MVRAERWSSGPGSSGTTPLTPGSTRREHGRVQPARACGRESAVTDGTGRAPRLIVGISRSPASWWALAWAVGEARRRGAELLLVNVFRPPVDPAAYGTSPPLYGTPRDPYADHVACGHELIRTAIGQAVGQIPGDVPVEQQVVSGRIAAELAGFARGDDLLVLGCRRRGWLRRLAPGSVARACARRSDCPVVIVPEPRLSALVVPWPEDHVRSHWFRRMPHHGVQAAS